MSLTFTSFAWLKPTHTIFWKSNLCDVTKGSDSFPGLVITPTACRPLVFLPLQEGTAKHRFWLKLTEEELRANRGPQSVYSLNMQFSGVMLKCIAQTCSDEKSRQCEHSSNTGLWPKESVTHSTFSSSTATDYF